MLNLLPAAKLMLMRICNNQSVIVTDYSDSINQLLEFHLVIIDKSTDNILLKPTTEGVSYLLGEIFPRDTSIN